jgi:hypothetical protein
MPGQEGSATGLTSPASSSATAASKLSARSSPGGHQKSNRRVKPAPSNRDSGLCSAPLTAWSAMPASEQRAGRRGTAATDPSRLIHGKLEILGEVHAASTRSSSASSPARGMRTSRAVPSLTAGSSPVAISRRTVDSEHLSSAIASATVSRSLVSSGPSEPPYFAGWPCPRRTVTSDQIPTQSRTSPRNRTPPRTSEKGREPAASAESRPLVARALAARQAGGHWFEPSTAHLQENVDVVRGIWEADRRRHWATVYAAYAPHVEWTASS